MARVIGDAGLRNTYVGTNNYDIGVNLAGLVMARHPDGGTICRRTVGTVLAIHNKRLPGVRETLAGTELGTAPGNPLSGEGGWTEISGCPLITHDDGDVAVQGMSDILRADPDLTAFLSTGAIPQRFDTAYRRAVEPYVDEMAIRPCSSCRISSQANASMT